MFFMYCFCFVYFENLEIIQTQNRRLNNINRKPHRKVTAQIKIIAYPGLAYSGFEQPGPGAPLLGLAIY